MEMATACEPCDMNRPSAATGLFVFAPYFRKQVWGGQKLATLCHKSLPDSQTGYGESWEISGHPQHVSRVTRGPYQGETVNELWQRSAEAWCPHVAVDRKQPFPLLLKWLDCRESLSVQVHPPHDISLKYLQEVGKSETWIVQQVDPGGRLYTGFREGITRADVYQALQDGTLASCLEIVEPHVGDVYRIPVGTVHAIGAGLVLAEVQTCSDAVFRLYDWDRLFDIQRPRPLQTERAMESIDWNRGPIAACPGQPLEGLPAGVTGTVYQDGPDFRLERYRVAIPQWSLASDEVAIWMIVHGSGWITHEAMGSVNADESARLPTGDSAGEWVRTGSTLLLTPGRGVCNMSSMTEGLEFLRILPR